MKRRTFLIGAASGAAAGGLLVGWAVHVPDLDGGPEVFNLVPGETALNGWVRIAADGTTTVAVPRAEMGQGIGTALAALVAEELDLAWDKVRIDFPAQAQIYANTTMLLDFMAMLPDAAAGHWAGSVRQAAANGVRQLAVVGTWGSASVRDAWLPMRTAGAAARQMLLAAAARKWNVDAATLSSAGGRVRHLASGRSAGYGELAPAAARLGLQGKPQLREQSAWRLIGKSILRLDVPAKVSGAALYGIDTSQTGMLHAAVRMAPHPGAALVRLHPDAILSEAGVEAVVRVPGGVAVVAHDWWHASQAAARLEAEFEVPAERWSDASLLERYQLLAASGEARLHLQRGDQQLARTGDGGPGGQVIQRDWLLPFQAHATMEPMNCSARFADGRCEVWMGHQMPTMLRWAAAEAAGIPAEHVVFHPAPLGGGLGRRAEVDLVAQAVTVATHLPGRLIRLVWSRSDDLRHDFYRPMALVRHRVALDAHGMPQGWHARVVVPSLTEALLSRLLPWAATSLLPDRTAVDGIVDQPYRLPALRVEHVVAPAGLPVGIWRGVGHTVNAFAREAMIDEMAAAAGQDPLRYREVLLAGSARHLRVLRSAAAAAGWERALTAGSGRGIALHETAGTIVAEVVEVAPQGGRLRVVRVTAAVDCGTPIDPDNIRAQVEGGILFGLSAALYSRIHLDDGQVREANFDGFACLRMADTPAVEVLVLATPDVPVGGIGEVGVPPLAPALAGALFAASGRRWHVLPMALSIA